MKHERHHNNKPFFHRLYFAIAFAIAFCVFMGLHSCAIIKKSRTKAIASNESHKVESSQDWDYYSYVDKNVDTTIITAADTESSIVPYNGIAGILGSDSSIAILDNNNEKISEIPIGNGYARQIIIHKSKTQKITIHEKEVINNQADVISKEADVKKEVRIDSKSEIKGEVNNPLNVAEYVGGGLLALLMLMIYSKHRHDKIIAERDILKHKTGKE